VKNEIKSNNSVRKEATVVIEKETIQNEENSVLQSFARDVKIPGFRNGKVPLALIKSQRQGVEGTDRKTVASKAFDDIFNGNNGEIFSLINFDINNIPDGCLGVEGTLEDGTKAIDLVPQTLSWAE
jgi:trigger factor